MSNPGRVLTRTSGGVRWITIDNPAKANCLTKDMFQGLRDAWLEASDDADTRVIVLEATGDRYFCAGADVTLFKERDTLMDGRNALAMSSRQLEVTKPVIAAMTGNVVGGGLALVADADVVIAARGVTFADPHVRHGQVCGYGAWRLAERVPVAEVVRMTLADVPLTAERAHEVGMIAELHDTADDVRAAAAAWAEKVAQHSPTAVLENLRLLRQLARSELNDRVVDEAQQALRKGWKDDGTAEAMARWSRSQD
jgi:enoyl-CoA hydratase/carnithine racemase